MSATSNDDDTATPAAAPAPPPAPVGPAIHLVVTHDFGAAGPFSRGQRITDPTVVRDFLAKYPNGYAVKVAAPT